MLTGTYLYIWALVAMGGYRPEYPKYEWQEAGYYQTPAACHAAAANLGKKPDQHRCISKEDGGVR